MAKKKKRTALPRLTVLAMSRAELVSFTSAVEQLRLLVNDLSILAKELQAARPAPRKRAAPAPALAAADQGDAPEGGAS